MSDNIEENKTPKTRSEYLQGKTELSDIDIINILDLPVEKINENNIQVYTQKSFAEIKNNSAELETLAENLKTDGEYLKYRSTFIAKSKLLYQESSVLCNEIPCMIILDEINEPAYLLPYGYARENKEDKAFADALKEKNNAFTEFKRVFSEDFSRAYKKAKSQGNEIFICLNDKKSNKSETFRRLKKIINASHSKNKNCSIAFYTEKEKLYFCYNIDKNGIITEKNINQVKKSGLTPLGKPSFAETIPNKINIPSTKQIINSNFHFVNDFYFESLLARGAVIEFARNSKIKNRNVRYLQSLTHLETITENAPEEILKKSNKIFIQVQKETKFYQALIAEQAENKTTLQEKPMENKMNQESELNIDENGNEIMFDNPKSETEKRKSIKAIDVWNEINETIAENPEYKAKKFATLDYLYNKGTDDAAGYDNSFERNINRLEGISKSDKQLQQILERYKDFKIDFDDEALAVKIAGTRNNNFNKAKQNLLDFIENKKYLRESEINQKQDQLKSQDEIIDRGIEAAAIKEHNQQNKLATQMILDQEDREQMEAISATMKSATKDFMDLNATPITEEKTMKSTENFESKEYWKNQFQYDNAEPFKAIDDYLEKGIRPKNNEFIFKNVPEVLKYSGISKNDIILTTGIINKAKNTHNLSDEEIKNAILSLSTPVAIFDSDKNKSENNTLSIINITDIEAENNKPIAITINLDNQRKGYEQKYLINEIRSIHDRTLIAKNGVNIVEEWAKAGLLRYVDDKKISNLVKEREDSFLLPLAKLDKNNINLSSKIVNSTAYQEIRTFSEFTEQQKAMEKEYQEYLGTISPDEKSSRRIDSGSVKQEENPSLQMEPGLIKKFNEMKKAIESREKQESQTAAEKTESAGSRKAENHEKPKVDLIKKAAKDFISAIKNGTAPFLNSTEKDFGKISLRPAAIVNASNGLPFSGEAQLLAQIYYQQQKMEGEIVTTFEGAKESGTFIANKPESKKNFVLANKTEQQQKEIIQKTRYFMPEACDEPDKIYAHALQKQRPQKISDYRDLIRHFENIPNGQKEISDLRIRIAHEHLKEIQSRFAMKKERILTVDEINERKKILQDYFKNLPEKHRESEKNAFENTFGLTLNPEEIFKTNLEGNFKNKKFEDVVKSNEKLTDQANRKLSSFIQKNSMEDKKLSEILHEEYNAQSKEEKETSKKLKIEAIGISEPETYLGKYLAACNANAEFVTDEDTIKAVQSNLVKKLEENYRVEKYGILKEIGQQAQRISNETTSKIAFDKAHSNKNTKEKKIEKEIGPIGMGN